jgi:CPA1 family monovalent cation:H+ antiporter
MSAPDVAAILVCLAALFGVINHFLLRLPSTIGLVVIALAASLAALGLDRLAPALGLAEAVRDLLERIDFDQTLLEGMLSFLLFAGALHVDLEQLRSQKWVVAAMASLGVLISAFLIAGGFTMLAGVPFLIALVFGILISPTDPVAVLGILKGIKAPASLETKIAGESLFNDGVAYVCFLIAVALAFPAAGEAPPTALDVAKLFALEALGGAALGALAGWLVYLAMRRIDDYGLEVLLTLALVMGSYALAHHLHMSGPIAVVIAGLFIGNTGYRFGMSETTRQHLDSFWRLIDEILNAVLFLLIGIEVFDVTLEAGWLLVALASIPLVLAARLFAVAAAVGLLRLRRSFSKGVIPMLTWGGLRGGISVALVLALPESEWKPMLLTVTYVIVIFSIVVQGLTIGPVIRRFTEAGEASERG